MKQQLKILLFVFLCLTIPTSHAGQNERIPLWGATYYDMTLNEVLANVTGARSNSEGAIPPFPNHGTQALATQDNIEIAGEHFKVWFMFSSGKLNQVTLSLVPKAADAKTMPNTDLGALYSKFMWLLNIKYGNPVNATRQEFGPPISALSTQWALGLTSIGLYIEKTQLEISYTAQYADDLRKL